MWISQRILTLWVITVIATERHATAFESCSTSLRRLGQANSIMNDQTTLTALNAFNPFKKLTSSLTPRRDDSFYEDESLSFSKPRIFSKNSKRRDMYVDEATIRREYDEWRRTYRKGKFNEERYKIFKESYLSLMESNTNAVDRLKLNEYADLTASEYQKTTSEYRRNNSFNRVRNENNSFNGVRNENNSFNGVRNENNSFNRVRARRTSAWPIENDRNYNYNNSQDNLLNNGISSSARIRPAPGSNSPQYNQRFTSNNVSRLGQSSNIDRGRPSSQSTAIEAYPTREEAIMIKYDIWRETFNKGPFDPEKYENFKENYETLLQLRTTSSDASKSLSAFETNRYADKKNASQERTLRSLYVDWCRQFAKNPDEYRFSVFWDNYETMRLYCRNNRIPIELGEYADCTAVEYKAALASQAERRAADALDAKRRANEATKELERLKRIADEAKRRAERARDRASGVFEKTEKVIAKTLDAEATLDEAIKKVGEAKYRAGLAQSKVEEAKCNAEIAKTAVEITRESLEKKGGSNSNGLMKWRAPW